MAALWLADGAASADTITLTNGRVIEADRTWYEGTQLRYMVQVQSSWFPLYDRNPQTFVPNIFWAKPEDYRKATQRIHHAPGQASFVELPLVVTP